MRLLRRNALGVYAVYAAAIASGLLVTPIVIHSIGTKAFGVWSFIGAVTIYLSILDFGVGPSIVRFAAEARGRQADDDPARGLGGGDALKSALQDPRRGRGIPAQELVQHERAQARGA